MRRAQRQPRQEDQATAATDPDGLSGREKIFVAVVALALVPLAFVDVGGPLAAAVLAIAAGIIAGIAIAVARRLRRSPDQNDLPGRAQR